MIHRVYRSSVARARREESTSHAPRKSCISPPSRAITSLRRQNVRDPWLAELEIYHKAATWVVEHNEFYQPAAADWTQEALDRGLLRARQAAQGETPWVNSRGHAVVRAYRSAVDGSMQPFGVIVPARYNPEKPIRLDVVLHGSTRPVGMSELRFMGRFDEPGTPPAEADYIELHPLGRVENCYRWAGETDVYDAITHFIGVEKLLNRHELIDLTRIVLRGFSMGGAGTWHLGLHRPTRSLCPRRAAASRWAAPSVTRSRSTLPEASPRR